MPGKVVLLSHHQIVIGRGFFTTLLVNVRALLAENGALSRKGDQ
jgi:hypothetical protein